ncbi:MAG TPA: hypothetical protein DCM14_04740 [Clostridiales bacterium UBA8153]|nr:hypothetical protein [Clostridiales bacterium UBA8153]
MTGTTGTGTDLEVLAKDRVRFLVGAGLSFSAGVVNGAATVGIVQERTMHMSGRLNDLVRDLAFNRPEGLLVGTLIASFVTGAIFAGFLVPRRGVPRVLMWSAGLLVAGAVVTALAAGAVFSTQLAVAASLALAGGLQNGATSQVVLGRTTHITGDLTDFALAVSVGDRPRIAFLFTKLAAFASGGMAGFLGVRYGHQSLVLLGCGLAVASISLYLTLAGSGAATAGAAH